MSFKTSVQCFLRMQGDDYCWELLLNMWTQESRIYQYMECGCSLQKKPIRGIRKLIRRQYELVCGLEVYLWVLNFIVIGHCPIDLSGENYNVHGSLRVLVTVVIKKEMMLSCSG